MEQLGNLNESARLLNPRINHLGNKIGQPNAANARPASFLRSRWVQLASSSLVVGLVLAAPAWSQRIFPATYAINFPTSLEVTEGDSLNISAALANVGCASYPGVVWNASVTGTGSNPAEPGDYGVPSPGVHTYTVFPESQNFLIPTFVDADADNEEAKLVLTHGGSGIIDCGSGNTFDPPAAFVFVNFIIKEPVATPKFRITQTASVPEGNAGPTPVILNIELIDPPPAPWTGSVNYATQNGTATVADNDYAQVNLTSVTLSNTENPKSITVNVNGDLKPELAETFQVKLLAPNSFPIEPLFDTATVTIVNEDAPPTITISDANPIEGDGGGTQMTQLIVGVTPPVGVPITVSFHTDNFNALPNPATPNVDYTSLTSSIIIPANQVSGVIDIPIVRDEDPEPTENFYVIIDSVNVAHLLPDNRGDIAISDDDAVALVPHLSISDAGHNEGNVGDNFALFFTVNRQDLPAAAVAGGTISVDYQTVNGSAAEPGDFQQTSGTFTFGPTEFTKTIQVNLVGDNTAEGDEEFFVLLTNPVGAVIDDDKAIGTIHDEDVSSLPLISIGAASRNEGNSGTSLMSFPVTLSAPSPVPVSFTYQTDDDTALPGTDYVADPPTQVTIAPGNLGTTVQVAIVGDTVVEPDETFDVVLSAPVNALLDTLRGTGTILNDDTNAPVVTINDVSITEGNTGTSLATFTVTLTPASLSSVSVDFASENDTATEPGDYQSINGQITFAPNETTKSLVVNIVGDATAESNETFKIRLSNIVGSATLADDLGIGTILNDDGVTLSINDATVTEGTNAASTTPVTLTVTLSAAQTAPVTVDWATANDSAVAPGDFVAANGTLSFEIGALSKTITLQVVADSSDENDESFKVVLANPQFGGINTPITLADDTGVVSIVDDDTATVLPNLTIDDASVTEGNAGTTNLRFEIRLDRTSTSAVSFDVNSVDGTATVADNDYVATNRNVVLAPGSLTAVVDVPVIGDTRVEGNEQMQLALVNVQGANLLRPQGIGTLVNDDTTTPPASTLRLVSTPNSLEGAGPATIVVERVGNLQNRAQVLVVAEPGTAQAGNDFAALREVVVWGAGEGGTREVNLTLVDDGLQEAEETINVFLAEPQGATLGQPNSGVVTILDDDTPMRLEVVGDANLNGKVGDVLELKVKVLRQDGQVVIGALVAFEAVAGPVRFPDDAPGARSDEQGIALRRVILGPVPGSARVRAFLGDRAEVAFLIQVTGNLGEVGGNPAGQPGVAGVLNEGCANATGELAEACAFVFGLGDPTQQRQALEEMTPRGVVAQVRSALQAPQNQNRNIGQRMEALRGGNAVRSFDQLSFAIQGQGLGMAPLQQAFGAAAKHQSPAAAEKKLADRVELALAKAQGRPAARAAQQGDAAASQVDPDLGESRWGMFVNGRMSFGDAPQRGEDPSYDFETQGLTAGFDYRVSNHVVVGAAVGWLTTESKLDSDGGSIETDGLSLNLYGTWYRENLYVEAVLGYGENDYEFTRVIVLPRPFQGQDEILAVGKPNSRQLSADIGFGYDFRVGEALTLTGIGRLGWIDTKIDPYAERGAGPFNLTFAQQNLDSLLAEAGIEASYPWSVSWGVLQPTLRLSYLHEFEDTAAVIRARFTADGGQRFFVVQAENPDRNYLNLAAGISATLPRGWATFLQYDTDLQREELDIYTVTGGIRFQF